MNKKTDLVPFPTILASIDGEVNSIDNILKHYEAYIVTLSTRRLNDGQGNPVVYVDNDIRRRLEILLTLKLPQFKITIE